MEAMQLTKENLDLITDYVSTKLQLVQKQEFSQTMSELKHLRESMQEGFKQMEKRFEQVDKRFEQVDKRFEQVDKRFEQVDKRFELMLSETNRKFDKVDQRFELILNESNRKFEKVDQRFDRIYSFMKWQTGLGFIMVAGIYLKLFLG